MAKKDAQATPNGLLRAARQERGWTQQQLADLIGAPQALNVTRWERGIAFPSAYYIQKLSQVFEKSPRELDLFRSGGETAQPEPAESVLWLMPYKRNPFFTGRDELLATLERALQAEQRAVLSQSYALSGLGGIGKTQIALEYAYRSRQHYRAVFWVRAASQETLMADYVALARLVELPGREEAEQDRVMEEVKCWLLAHPGWLLILDNVDDLSMASKVVPAGGQGHLLITTRAQATGKIALSIPVETMAEEEACLLLLRRSRCLGPTDPLEVASVQERETALAIARELDGLPLALDQAGAYIEEVGSGLNEYLQLYQRDRTRLLARPSEISPDYPFTAATTWSLAFQQIAQANPAAADLLRLCAFLAPDAIPESIFTRGAATLGPAISSTAADPFLLREALQILRRFSLVRRNVEASTITIHRLVQAVLKDQLDEPARRLWAERTVRAVHAAFPVVKHETWPRCQQCLPHVMTCSTLLREYHLIFSEAAQVLDRAGEYLRERGLYGQAAPLLQQALSMQEQLAGPEHPDTATALDHLALDYQELGTYEQAEHLYQRALAIRQHILGPEHPETATTWFNLDWLYYLQGKYEQAEAAAQRALQIRERALGPEHPDTLNVFGDLGLIYLLRGKYDQAEALLRRGVTLYEQAFGPEYHDLGDVLNNLALVYLKQGKYEQAEPLFLRAIALAKKLNGPEHPNVAFGTDNLAQVYQHQGRYEQAESCYIRALALAEQVLGPEHPETATILNHLGRLRCLQGKEEEAETLLRRSLAICEQALGPEHPKVATVLSNLAQLSQIRGHDEEAGSLLRRALSIREEVLGPQHPDTIAMRSLSMALQQEQQQPGHMTQEAEPSPAVPSQRNPPAGLSAREVEVLSLVACGLTNPQIAERLLLSEKTVANHLTRMFKKIGCPNRAAAVAFAMRHGIT